MVLCVEASISQAWPNRPKPVTSVPRLVPDVRAAVAAAAFNDNMDWMAASRSPGSISECVSTMWAVVTIPVPRGLVSHNVWPGSRLSPLVSRWSGSPRPVTDSP